MTPSELFVITALMVGGVLLVGANVALQRLARPDRGTERIAGCCGMALPAAITDPQEDDR
jgi:hypothetical protein